MANPNALTRADLVTWLQTGADAFTAHVAVPIVNADQDDLATIFQDFHDALAAAETAVVAAKAAYENAVSVAQVSATELLFGIQGTKYTFKAAPASQNSYAAIGLTPPAIGRNAIIPMPPEIVAVTGLSTGVNTLTLKNGNRPGSVNIEIYRRVGGNTHPWVLVGATKKQKFVDDPAPVGVMTEYKLRASSSTSVSSYSNTAACYTDAVP